MAYGQCFECEKTYSDEQLNICENCGVSFCEEHYNKESQICNHCNEELNINNEVNK